MGIFAKRDNTPAMVDLTKKAKISLEKKGLSQLRAAVYLVLDHSGSMENLYRNGHVQHLGEQALGLSANVDDDGLVPVIFFHHRAFKAVDLEIGQHEGGIKRLEKKVNPGWGGTNYSPAMEAVVDHYERSGATDPAFVIFQTDGRCGDPTTVQTLLRLYSQRPIFWQFVGFGPEDSPEFEFLRNLDKLNGRIIDNAGFCATGSDPSALTDEELYDRLLNEFPQWLAEARNMGLVR